MVRQMSLIFEDIRRQIEMTALSMYWDDGAWDQPGKASRSGKEPALSNSCHQDTKDSASRQQSKAGW